MIVATAGHVDHGKTSLVKHLTGTNTDRLDEEQKRGLSINLGFAYQHVGDRIIGYVDVPGHIDFINNMLAGVANVDVALLVVALDDGIMPQTEEHLNILKILDVQNIIVVLTKVDLVNDSRIEEVTNQTLELLQKNSYAECSVFQVSNKTAEGVQELKNYLIQLAENETASGGAKANEYCRFIIDRSFIVKGIGTVVTGTVVSGELKIGDSMLHSRSEEKARIKSLRVDNKELDCAVKGQRVAINITINLQNIHRGDWLLDEQLFLPLMDVDAKLTLIDGDERFLKQSGEVHFYTFASHHQARLRRLQFSGDGNLWVQVKTRQPFFSLSGDRFIIRDAAGRKTLGGGVLIDIHPPPRRRHTPERRSYLNSLSQSNLAAMQVLLKEFDGEISLSNFAQARNLTEKALQDLLQPLILPDLELAQFLAKEAFRENYEQEVSENNKYQAVLLGDDLVKASLISSISFIKKAEIILEKINSYQLEFPDRQGIAPLELKRLSKLSGDYGSFQRILQKLLAIRVVVRTGTLIHTPSHKAQDDPEVLAFFDTLKPFLQKDPLTAPRTRELCDLLNVELTELDRHLQRLCLSGKLAQVAANRFYLPESLSLHAAIAEELVNDSNDNMFSVIDYRDRSKVGRNLCIQILEFFDRQGYTARRSNRRMIKKPKELLFD